jgi:hypothetical protein
VDAEQPGEGDETLPAEGTLGSNFDRLRSQLTFTMRLPSASAVARSPGSMHGGGVELLEDRRAVDRTAPTGRRSRVDRRLDPAPSNQTGRRSSQRAEASRRVPRDRSASTDRPRGRTPMTDVLRLTRLARISGSLTLKRGNRPSRTAACSIAASAAGEGSGTLRMCVWPTNCMSAEWICSGSRAGCTASLRDQRLALGALAGEDGAAPRLVERRDRPVQRVDEIVPQIGDDAAERIGDARPRRHQHFGEAELAGQRGGVQRAGAAEGEQREVARIVAARDRHHADGAGHLHVAEPQHRARRRVAVEADVARPILSAKIRAHALDRTGGDGEQLAGLSRPSTRLASVMVGSGAAAAVADRARPAPALCGPTWIRPDASTRAIEPPPAPTVCTSTIGTWIGIAYSISISLETAGRRCGSAPRRSRCRPCRR